jgi:hypothetical protein
VKRTVKPHALGCFGDIAIALGANFARYLNTTMDWLVNAASAAQISNPVSFWNWFIFTIRDAKSADFSQKSADFSVSNLIFEMRNFVKFIRKLPFC